MSIFHSFDWIPANTFSAQDRGQATKEWAKSEPAPEPIEQPLTMPSMTIEKVAQMKQITLGDSQSLIQFQRSPWFRFPLPVAAEEVERRTRLDVAPVPSTGAPGQCFLVVQSPAQRREVSITWPIAKDNRRIPQDAAAFCTPQWRFAKSCPELSFVIKEKFPKFDSIVLRERLENQLLRYLSLSIPGTNLLANVATKQPIADRLTKLDWNR